MTNPAVPTLTPGQDAQARLQRRYCIRASPRLVLDEDMLCGQPLALHPMQWRLVMTDGEVEVVHGSILACAVHGRVGWDDSIADAEDLG